MYDIAEERDDRSSPPLIKQLSIFLPNRVGALLAVTRCLDAYAIRICALSILDAADHAVLRIIVDHPGLAQEALSTEGYAVFESDVLGVVLPAADSGGIKAVLSALLLAELNVHYVYSLIAMSTGTPIVAISVEDSDSAAQVLESKGLELIGQAELL
ncbi:MAG: acetolactate synthase [Planctomycetes bacterium]|nr:acetolactate synthase [Planctomycetota bacterium]